MTTMPRLRERIGKLESRWTMVDGLRIHARASVDPVPEAAPAVVLVHGAGISSRYMVPTAERLAPFYRVSAPDLPGFGKSGKPPRALDVLELADALAGWMEAVGLEGAALLGNSAGGQIAVDLAARHPDHVERLVLAGPTTDPPGRSFLKQVWRWALNGRGEPRSLLPVIIRDYRDDMAGNIPPGSSAAADALPAEVGAIGNGCRTRWGQSPQACRQPPPWSGEGD